MKTFCANNASKRPHVHANLCIHMCDNKLKSNKLVIEHHLLQLNFHFISAKKVND